MGQRQSFDILVIGSGPGGYVAAVRAAKLGFKTAVVEREALGGICLNWGCIPSKNLLQTAETFRGLGQLEKMGIRAENPGFDFAAVVARSRQAAGTLSKAVGHLFKTNGVTLWRGRASFLSRSVVEIGKSEGAAEEVEAGHIILASGASPKSIPGVEIDGQTVLSSREAMVLKEVPKRLAIVGAGAIGVEFAYIYSSFGCQVTLLEALPRILPGEDEEVSALLAKVFKKYGVKVEAGVKIEAVKRSAEGVELTYSRDSQQQTLAADCLLMAVGVTGNIEGMGLEKIGVECQRGFVKVDRDSYQTSVPGVYAIGDVIGPPMLAHVASAEGIWLVETLRGIKRAPLDYDNVPRCTYCLPQVASLGLTEAEALARGHQIKVGRLPLAANGKAVATDHSLGFAKLIFDQATGHLLGAHLIGHEATELIAELGVAKSCGATYRQILHTIHAHPTISEAVMEAAGAAYGEAIAF